MPNEIGRTPLSTQASNRTREVGGLLQLISWCGRRPGIGTLAIALLLSAPVPLVMALARDVALSFAHHDVFIPLDAAWRTLQGQWPHTDFYSPIGLAYFWLHGAAAWIWGMDGKVVIEANLLALPFVLVPALILAWNRLNSLFTIILTVLLATLVAGPTFLDGPLRAISELANYNRIGLAICTLVCLWALCPRRHETRPLILLEALVLGVLMLILLYLKITFFMLAAVIVVVGCVVTRRFWRDAVAAGLVGAAGVVVLEIIHPGLLLSYAEDVRRAGASNQQFLRPLHTPLMLVDNLNYCVVVALLAAALLWTDRKQIWTVSGLLIVALSCDLVSTQNFGSFAVPLIVLIMLLAQRLAAKDATGVPVLQAVGMVAVVMTAAPFLFTQTEGTAYEALTTRRIGVALGTGNSPLADVVWLPNAVDKEFMPPGYTVEDAGKWDKMLLPATLAAAILADGVAMLEHDGLAQRRIGNLGFSNPFPVALKAPSPRGVALWWDEDRTFTVSGVTPEMILGDAEVVMVPKMWWFLSNTDHLFGVAHDKLKQDFTPHESKYWTAWVKNSSVGASN